MPVRLFSSLSQKLKEDPLNTKPANIHRILLMEDDPRDVELTGLIWAAVDEPPLQVSAAPGMGQVARAILPGKAVAL